MGCSGSKSSNLPPAEHLQFSHGGSLVKNKQLVDDPTAASGAGHAAAPADDVQEVSNGGSLILMTRRIRSDDEMDWEFGDPIVRPLHPQTEALVEHTRTAAAANSGLTPLALHYGFFSERGMSVQQKPNQDSLLVKTNLGGHATRSLFAVFDGHGPFGEHASQFCRTRIAKVVTESHDYATKPAAALANSFVYMHRDFTSDATKRKGVDATVSGTTAVAALVDGTTLHVANCGDSRAIVLRGVAGSSALVPHIVTDDHKPSRADERRRVAANRDARVYQESQLRAQGDRNKYYICRQNQSGRVVYGVMFTRSIGDSDATHTLGIICEPEMQQLELTEDDQYLVLATDGVWDVMTNEEVAALVARYAEAQQAAWELVQESIRRWTTQNPVRRDDITAMVCRFDWTTPAAGAGAGAGAASVGAGAGAGASATTAAATAPAPAVATATAPAVAPVTTNTAAAATDGGAQVAVSDVGVAVDGYAPSTTQQ